MIALYGSVMGPSVGMFLLGSLNRNANSKVWSSRKTVTRIERSTN